MACEGEKESKEEPGTEPSTDSRKEQEPELETHRRRDPRRLIPRYSILRYPSQSSIETEKELEKKVPAFMGYEQIAIELLNLAEKPFDLKEFSNTTLLEQTMGTFGKREIRVRVLRRWEKWMAKKGKDLRWTSAADFWVACYRLVTIEQMARGVLGLMGKAGGEAGEYHCYCKSVQAAIKDKNLTQWAEAINQRYQSWKTRKRLDKRLLKTLAHMTAKACFQVKKIEPSIRAELEALLKEERETPSSTPGA